MDLWAMPRENTLWHQKVALSPSVAHVKGEGFIFPEINPSPFRLLITTVYVNKWQLLADSVEKVGFSECRRMDR